MTFSRTIRYACLTLALTGLYACNDATATPKPQDAPKAKPVTRAECLAMTVKVEKIACIQKLSEQSRTDLVETNRRIRAQEAEKKKLDQEGETLLKEFEKDVLDEN